MRVKDFLIGLRQYEQRKERLRKATERMDHVVSIASTYKSWDGNGLIHIPFFSNTEEYIVEVISEMKAAHYSFEELFMDQEEILIQMLRQAAMDEQPPW